MGSIMQPAQQLPLGHSGSQEGQFRRFNKQSFILLYIERLTIICSTEFVAWFRKENTYLSGLRAPKLD